MAGPTGQSCSKVTEVSVYGVRYHSPGGLLNSLCLNWGEAGGAGRWPRGPCRALESCIPLLVRSKVDLLKL